MTEVLFATELTKTPTIEIGSLLVAGNAEVLPETIPKMACGGCPGAGEDRDTSVCNGPEEWTHNGVTYKQCGAPYRYDQ
jgi:hypothetical protein